MPEKKRSYTFRELKESLRFLAIFLTSELVLVLNEFLEKLRRKH